MGIQHRIRSSAAAWRITGPVPPCASPSGCRFQLIIVLVAEHCFFAGGQGSRLPSSKIKADGPWIFKRTLPPLNVGIPCANEAPIQNTLDQIVRV